MRKLYKLSPTTTPLYFVLVVLFLIIFPLIADALPPVCSHVSSITFSGSNDVIRKSAGATVLAVFAPLQCANCYNYLRRLNEIANANRQTKVIVIAPDFESNHIISRTSTAFPLLHIDRAGEGWPRFGAKNFDVMIIDSCGRIAQVFQLPSSDVTSNSAVQTALANTISGKSNCPPSPSCQGGSSQFGQRSIQNSRTNGYDSRNSQGNHQYLNQAKKINAYIEPQKYYKSQSQQQHQQQPQQVQQPQQYQQHQQYQNQPQYQPTQNWKPQQPQQQQPPQQYQQQHQPYQNQQVRNQYPQQQNEQYLQNQATNYNNGQGSPTVTSKKTTTTTVATTTTSDYEDYYNGEGGDQLVKTTVSPQTQIPRPPSFQPNWPTYPPSPYHQQNQQNYQNYQNHQQQNNNHFFNNNPNYPQQQIPYNHQQYQPGSLALDSNLPCSAYTDDLCFHQQERPGVPLPPCCNKGIYLTDVCVPGKCSNSTVQLCCFQKFLQAKYTCCSDPNQDESTTPTNMFNRCCHDFFVAEDSCCTKEAAAKYWSSVYEVCYPTTHVDYSNVRFEVHFAEGVRVLDLNVNRQWEFNCTYGKKRQQYAYLP